ncbi:MAG: substrate-binding domain-containing protein [Vicinamibacteria bacterium]
MNLRSVSFALLLLTASFAQAAEYQVVVNSSNPINLMTKEQVRKAFMKKLAKWDTGTPMVPIDQGADSSARAAFSRTIHGKPVSAMVSYWQQQIFAGRDVPPIEKTSDAAVLALVKANPGAIGYVSGSASVEGVKLIVVQ